MCTGSYLGGKSMTRVGIVGCGRVAEYHLRFMSSMKDCQVVGLADTNIENARSLGARFGVDTVYPSLEELLDSQGLDVLHIATPPACHYSDAKAAIERGVNILIEKPVALQQCDLVEIYDLATAKGVSICPDFIQLFHPSMERARALIESGELGRVIHCESNLSVDLNIPELREVLGLHWSYRLPGGVLHNYITHPLYLVLNWVGFPKRIVTIPKSFGTLPQGLTDHMDIVLEGERITGRVVLSAVPRFTAYYVQVFCEKGIVLVDFETMTLRVARESKLPRVINRVTSNFETSYQLSKGAVANVAAVLRKKLVPYHGLRTLMQRYYASIREHTEPPISRELALAVGKVEDSVSHQGGKLHLHLSCRPSRRANVARAQQVLVTGATGYLGTEVARHLVREGYYVRALVRPLSHTEELERLGVAIIYGDIRDLQTLQEAAGGIDIIVHVAAGLRGSNKFILDSCILGATNVAEAARANAVQRVIYISSMSVYSFAAVRRGRVITETSALDSRPEKRGISSMGKRWAEDVALSHLSDPVAPWTILRPSLIFGNGRDLVHSLEMKVGNTLICLGNRKKLLRLVHVADVAEAIIRVIRTDSTRGRVFNVSHHDQLHFRDYVKKCLRAGRYKNLRVLYLSYWLGSLGAVGVRLLRRVLGRGPNMSREQLRYLYSSVVVDSSSLRDVTGWKPSAGLLEQLLW